MMLLLLHTSNDSNWFYSSEKSLPMGFYQTKGIFKYLEFDWVDCLIAKAQSQQTDSALINWISVKEILLYYLHTTKDLIFCSL